MFDVQTPCALALNRSPSHLFCVLRCYLFLTLTVTMAKFSGCRNLIHHTVQHGIALSGQALAPMLPIHWEVSYTSPLIRSTSFSSGQLLSHQITNQQKPKIVVQINHIYMPECQTCRSTLEMQCVCNLLSCKNVMHTPQVEKKCTFYLVLTCKDSCYNTMCLLHCLDLLILYF